MRDIANLIAGMLVVGIAVASPCLATTYFSVPDYVMGGKAVALDLDLLVQGEDGRFTRFGALGDRSERYASLEKEILEFVATRVEAAGYEFEADRDHWQRTDLGYYESTGQPHYLLNTRLDIKPIFSADGVEVAVAFAIEARLYAQFADPDETWIERFSDQRLGGAVVSELPVRVLDHFSAILDTLFAPGTESPPIKETRTLLEGRFSVDLIEAGYENLREYFLGSADRSTRVNLYREPRSQNPYPIAFFDVGGRPKLMIDDEAHFLVTESSGHSSSGARSVYEIRLRDGSLIRRFSTDDLLTEMDRRRLPRRPTARVDSERRALVVEVPTCLPAGVFRGLDYVCADDDHVDLAVDLETGNQLDPVRDILPRPVGQFELTGLEADHDLGSSHGARCTANRSRQDFADASPVPLDDSWIPTLTLPKYTPIAEKVRIAGRVELVLLVEPSGEVACIQVIKGLPMGLSEASVKTAFDWRFEPVQGSDRLRLFRVVLTGSLVIRQPPFD